MHTVSLRSEGTFCQLKLACQLDNGRKILSLRLLVRTASLSVVDAHASDVTGSRLLGNAGIAEAIRTAARPRLERLEFDAARVLQGAARVAFFDLGSLFDHQGRVRPLPELDELTAAAIASFEMQTRQSEDGQTVVTTTKVKFLDRLRALELLAKYYGLLKDRVGVEIDDAKLAALPPEQLAVVRKLASEAARVVAALQR